MDSGLQQAGGRDGLNDRKDNGQVARVLGNFAAAKFAFFLQALQVRETTVINCKMMDDVMYGMMPRGRKSSDAGNSLR